RAAAIVLSAKGDRAVTIGYSSIATWDATTGRLLDARDTPVTTFLGGRVVSSDGRYALLSVGEWSKVETILWDVLAKRIVRTLRAKGAASVFSPDSSRLAMWQAEKDPILRVEDVRTGEVIASIKGIKAGSGVRPFFMPDGRSLLVCGAQRIVGVDI